MARRLTRAARMAEGGRYRGGRAVGPAAAARAERMTGPVTVLRGFPAFRVRAMASG